MFGILDNCVFIVIFQEIPFTKILKSTEYTETPSKINFFLILQRSFAYLAGIEQSVENRHEKFVKDKHDMDYEILKQTQFQLSIFIFPEFIGVFTYSQSQ